MSTGVNLGNLAALAMGVGVYFGWNYAIQPALNVVTGWCNRVGRINENNQNIYVQETARRVDVVHRELSSHELHFFSFVSCTETKVSYTESILGKKMYALPRIENSQASHFSPIERLIEEAPIPYFPFKKTYTAEQTLNYQVDAIIDFLNYCRYNPKICDVTRIIWKSEKNKAIFLNAALKQYPEEQQNAIIRVLFKKHPSFLTYAEKRRQRQQGAKSNFEYSTQIPLSTLPTMLRTETNRSSQEKELTPWNYLNIIIRKAPNPYVSSKQAFSDKHTFDFQVAAVTAFLKFCRDNPRMYKCTRTVWNSENNKEIFMDAALKKYSEEEKKAIKKELFKKSASYLNIEEWQRQSKIVNPNDQTMLHPRMRKLTLREFF